MLDLGELTALHIGNRRAEHKRVVLVVDNRFPAAFGSTVVVIRRQLFQIRLERAVLNPPVEIQPLGLIPVHNFAGAHKPIIQKFLGWLGL